MGAITKRGVLDVVSGATGVTVERICSKTRMADVVLARFSAMYLMKAYSPSAGSLKSIALSVGRSDHTTVINGLGRVLNAIAVPATDPALAATVSACESALIEKFGPDAKKMDWVVDNR